MSSHFYKLHYVGVTQTETINLVYLLYLFFIIYFIYYYFNFYFSQMIIKRYLSAVSRGILEDATDASNFDVIRI